MLRIHRNGLGWNTDQPSKGTIAADYLFPELGFCDREKDQADRRRGAAPDTSEKKEAIMYGEGGGEI